MIDVSWSNTIEAVTALDNLAAYRRALSLEREKIERDLDDAALREREIRIFLTGRGDGDLFRVGDILSG